MIRSEGEAEAASLISEALKEHGTGLIDVRRIDAAKEIADVLSKSPNKHNRIYVRACPLGYDCGKRMCGATTALEIFLDRRALGRSRCRDAARQRLRG